MFNYNEAFSRTLGWVTSEELNKLQDSRIAIAGMGGVGGGHLLTLARLGIGSFNISDMDTFELANFNRQAGANMETIGRPKVETLATMAKAINPALSINQFSSGINEQNLDEFLDGVDLYVDSLDFFAVSIRRQVFAACAEKNIPAITAAPLGMGVSFLCFMPGKMTFEEYFRLEGQPLKEQLIRFLVGLSPAMLQQSYLADPQYLNFDEHKGPSTPMACELCAGLAATYALKLLLGRGPIVTAPWGLHFDAYRNKVKKTWRPGGNNNPLQRLILALARKKLGS